jgi:hypothetical protein
MPDLPGCRPWASSFRPFSFAVKGEVARTHARITSRTRGARRAQLMRRVGYAAGGRCGSRLLGDFGVVTSDDTILRRVTAPSGLDHTDERVRVLGVDDWAWRKQQHYATILMDLERRRVINLLPVRSADSFYKWLLNHRGGSHHARPL